MAQASKEAPVVPVELADALAQDSEASMFFDKLAPSHKRRYCEWVSSAKGQATREARARKALDLLKDKQKELKVGGFMGDVGLNRKIDDIPELRDRLIALCEAKDHKAASRYSLLLADHILQVTNTPHDEAIDKCFDVNMRWQEGTATFHEARDVAGIMNRLAQQEKDPVLAKVFRAMGQVAATPHVKRHALIASDYAVGCINLIHPGDMEEVRKERNTQIALMESV